MRTTRNVVKFAAALAFHAAVSVSGAQAADIEVGAKCSLADAIRAANTDAAAGGCPAGSGADSITLTADITLDAPLPRIASDMTFVGGGFTISGDSSFPIFDAIEGDISLHNVTLAEGKGRAGGGGGAVDLGGTAQMTIRNSSLIDNQVRGYGGAIFVNDEARLDVANTTISGNKALFGGALAMMHQSQVTLTHVTIANNSTSYLAGGIYMILQPVYAGDGIFLPDRAALKLRNSIVASNEGGDCFARLSQNSGNLIGDGSCIAARSGDPKLGDLSQLPAMHILLDGSPAINSADPEYCLPTDQRGVDRPQGDACDIGAVESKSAMGAPPGPEASVCTLAVQIRAANTDQAQGKCPAGSGADTIDLTADIVLDAALPPITSELSINSHGFTISGNHRHRIFNVQGGKLALNNMTLTEGYSTTMGSAIYVLDGALELSNIVIADNKAEIEGALVNEFGSMRIFGSAFSNNLGTAIVNGGDASIILSTFRHNSGFFGGAIQNRGTLDVRSSEIVENYAESWGAAVMNEGTASVVDCTISRNADEGKRLYGVIYNQGHLTVAGNTFSDNRAESDEKVLRNSLGDLIAEDNAFSGTSPEAGWDGPPSD